MHQTDPTIVLDLIEAFRRSKTMFAAVEFGIFDKLACGPLPLDALAAATGTQPGALCRLLDGCAGLGLLSKDGGLYSNTEVATAYLCRDSQTTLSGYILYSNEALYPMWGHLEDALREGTHRWTQTFGMERALFSHFFRTDEAMRTFLMGMHGFGQLSSPSLVRVFNLNGYKRLADLGGASGHLAVAACERYANLRGVVFDLPQVCDFAREMVARSRAAERIEVQAGDFFLDALPEADLYTMGRILHDWTDEKARILLRRLYDALPVGGALLIAEKLLSDDKTAPMLAAMQSLNMLICTEGRERTAAEYEALLREAGFAEVEARPTGTPLDAVLARKK